MKKHRKKIIIVVILLLAILIPKFMLWSAEYQANSFCNRATELKDREKIRALVSLDRQENKKYFLSYQNVMSVKFPAIFLTIYSCNMYFDEHEQLQNFDISYTD